MLIVTFAPIAPTQRMPTFEKDATFRGTNGNCLLHHAIDSSPGGRRRVMRPWPGFRVPVLDSHPAAAASGAVRGAVAEVARLVSDAGGAVEASLTLLPDQEVMVDKFRRMLGAPGGCPTG